MAAKLADTLQVDLRFAASLGGLRQLRDHRPDVVHLIAGPSAKTAAVFASVALAAPKARRVLSAVHPIQIALFRRLCGPWAPHLVLAHSASSEDEFRKVRLSATYRPIGPDLGKLHPLSAEEREGARKRLGILHDQRVALHVGHLKRGRGIERLKELAAGGWLPLMVVSSSTRPDHELEASLDRDGVQFLRGFQPDMRMVYGAADAYVFPTSDATQAIETPSSVLEAMACGLPVLTTRYPGLSELFSEGPGYGYLDTARALGPQLDAIAREGDLNVARLRGSPLILDSRQLDELYWTLRPSEGVK